MKGHYFIDVEQIKKRTRMELEVLHTNLNTVSNNGIFD